MSAGRLLYDADCGLCTRCAHWLTAHAPELGVAPLQTSELTGADAERALREVPFVHPDGRLTWGSAAIADALASCREPWGTAGRLLRTAPVQLLARPAYALVARNRHRLPGGTCGISREVELVE